MKKISLVVLLSIIVFPLSTHALIERITNGDPTLFPSPNNHSYYPQITPNGRYILFQSDASNLVPNDTNGFSDLFVKDNQANTIVRVNVSSNGDEANNIITSVGNITSDGRYVVFSSTANNLVDNDTNNDRDVFVRDLVDNTTIRVSVYDNGDQSPGQQDVAKITDDGRYVFFRSTATDLATGDPYPNTIYMRDLINNTTRGADSSMRSAALRDITPDGRFVIFEGAPDPSILNDGPENGVFLKDMQNNIITRISRGCDDSNSQNCMTTMYTASITPDGRYVLFRSDATTLVANDTNGIPDLFVRDTVNNTTTRVNVATDGSEANSASDYGKISADGRYVVFNSYANNLVPNDTNGQTDTFVRDLVNNTTTRISVDNSGNQADNGGSWNTLDFTPDGRYVTFDSNSTNLVPNDTNSSSDIFVRDLQLNTTTRISVDNGGGQAQNGSQSARISADGQSIVFQSRANYLVPNDTNNLQDIYLRSTQPNTTTRISRARSSINANGVPRINLGRNNVSSDGRYIVFASMATNIVPNDTNGAYDIFVKDMQTNTTTRVSVDENGNQLFHGGWYGSISADGRYVVFQSDDSLVSTDTNGFTDIYMRDLVNNTVTRVSVDESGNQGDEASYFAMISADGNYVTFVSAATNLTPSGNGGIFVKNLINNTVKKVNIDTNGNESTDSAYLPNISANGRYVVFYSDSDTLVPNDTNGVEDVFVRDLQLNTTTRVSVDSNGNEANAGGYDNSEYASISSDGRYVIFISEATNLVPNDTNGVQDVFVRDTINNTTTRVNIATDGSQANDESYNGNISANGRYVVFASLASNIGSGNGQGDIFVRDLVKNTTVRVDVDNSGNQGNGSSPLPASISFDGKYVVFQSNATNLVPGENNPYGDLYLVTTFPTIPTILSPTSGSVNTGSYFSVTGTGTIGSLITLNVSGNSYTGIVDGAGNWNLSLTGFTGGIYTITTVQSTTNYLLPSPENSIILRIQNIPLIVPQPVIPPQGGFGGGSVGGTTSTTVSTPAPTTTPTPSTTSSPGTSIQVTTPQQLADTILKLTSIELVEDPIPEPPVLIVPVTSVGGNENGIIHVDSTTPNEAIKSAILYTQTVTAGGVAQIKTVENPAFSTEKKCYSPREIVEITLGKNTTQKDLLVYQALLKSYDLTMFTNTDLYRPDSGLKRHEAAKMFVNFAKHILCREAKQKYTNQYDDLDGIDPGLVAYVKTAYEYGILKGSKGKYRPLDVISHKEFVAALMRMFINEDMDVQGRENDWDVNYKQAFKDYGLDSIVGIDDNIERYDMSKIMYKLYYNTTYQRTDKGYVLPYSK